MFFLLQSAKIAVNLWFSKIFFVILPSINNKIYFYLKPH